MYSHQSPETNRTCTACGGAREIYQPECPACGSTAVTISAAFAAKATATAGFQTSFIQRLAAAAPTPAQLSAVVAALQSPAAALGPDQAVLAIQQAAPDLVIPFDDLLGISPADWSTALQFFATVLALVAYPPLATPVTILAAFAVAFERYRNTPREK